MIVIVEIRDLISWGDISITGVSSHLLTPLIMTFIMNTFIEWMKLTLHNTSRKEFSQTPCTNIIPFPVFIDKDIKSDMLDDSFRYCPIGDCMVGRNKYYFVRSKSP